jgi:mRNA-degrading endonuclease RelE of RelBE toxin-antitoxin system
MSGMQVEFAPSYSRERKKALKRVSESDIVQTEEALKTDTSNPSLHFKKIACAKDKNCFSARIGNTGWRILLTVFEQHNLLYLRRIIDHDEYERLIRDC